MSSEHGEGMQSGGKKKGRVKGKTLDITEFLQDVPRLNWAQAMEEEQSALGRGGNEVTTQIQVKAKIIQTRSQLPSAPKSSRGPKLDPDTVPTNGPFLARIWNIDFKADESDVRDFFAGAQIRVKEIRLHRDSSSKFNSKGSGMVEFESREDLIDAVNLEDAAIMDRELRIDLADDRGDRQGRTGYTQSSYRNRNDSAGMDNPGSEKNDWRSGAVGPQTQSVQRSQTLPRGDVAGVYYPSSGEHARGGGGRNQSYQDPHQPQVYRPPQHAVPYEDYGRNSYPDPRSGQYASVQAGYERSANLRGHHQPDYHTGGYHPGDRGGYSMQRSESYHHDPRGQRGYDPRGYNQDRNAAGRDNRYGHNYSDYGRHEGGAYDYQHYPQGQSYRGYGGRQGGDHYSTLPPRGSNRQQQYTQQQGYSARGGAGYGREDMNYGPSRGNRNGGPPADGPAPYPVAEQPIPPLQRRQENSVGSQEVDGASGPRNSLRYRSDSQRTNDSDHSAAADTHKPHERKKLTLAPRSKPLNAPSESEEETAKRNNAIFGGAKPVDTEKREREIEEKIERDKKELKKKIEQEKEERVRGGQGPLRVDTRRRTSERTLSQSSANSFSQKSPKSPGFIPAAEVKLAPNSGQQVKILQRARSSTSASENEKSRSLDEEAHPSENENAWERTKGKIPEDAEPTDEEKKEVEDVNVNTTHSGDVSARGDGGNGRGRGRGRGSGTGGRNQNRVFTSQSRGTGERGGPRRFSDRGGRDFHAQQPPRFRNQQHQNIRGRGGGAEGDRGGGRRGREEQSRGKGSPRDKAGGSGPGTPRNGTSGGGGSPAGEPKKTKPLPSGPQKEKEMPKQDEGPPPSFNSTNLYNLLGDCDD